MGDGETRYYRELADAADMLDNLGELVAKHGVGSKLVRAYCKEMGWRYNAQGAPSEWYLAWRCGVAGAPAAG